MIGRTQSPGHVRRVRDLMQRNVVTIAPDATLMSAARRMRDHKVGSLPVLEGGDLVGMITDRDFVVRAFAEGGDLMHLCVREVMSAGAVSCPADRPVDEAAALLREPGFSRLPVTNRRGRLVGLVSLRDITGQPYRPKPYRAVFYRRMTSSAGRHHEVKVANVHLSPALRQEELGPTAISRLERNYGRRPWDSLADRYEIAEDE